MDASQTTATRKMRSRYFDYLERNCAINKGTNITRPLVSGVPPGAGGYTDAYLEIVKAPTVVTGAESTAVCPPPPPTPPSYTYTFCVTSAYGASPNYFYRIFNPLTNTWGDLIDSGLAKADYSIANNSIRANRFWVLFYNETAREYTAQFLDQYGALVRIITWPDGDDGDIRSVDKGFAYYTSTGGSTICGAYFFDSDTYITQTFPETNRTNDFEMMDNCAIFFNRQNIYSRTQVYFVKDTDTYFTFLMNCTEYGYNFYYKSNAFTFTYGNNGNDFYDGICLLLNDGSNSTYPFANSTTYDSVNSFIYGELDQYSGHQLYNAVTDSNDFYVFENVLPIVPVIKTNVSGDYDYYYYQNRDTGYATTYGTNHFGILKSMLQMNYIRDGGRDMFDNGNFISVEATADTGATTFGVTDGYYDISGSAAGHGFYIGNTVNYPHMSFAYTNDGHVLLRARGNVGSDAGASVTNYNGSITCTNSRVSQYWMNVNYDAGDPTIGDLWFTIEVPAWGSSATLIGDTRKISDDNTYNHYVDISGHNILFCKALLSKKRGAYITQSEVEAFLADYVQNASLPTSFSAFSIASFRTWHNANGLTIAQNTIPNWNSYRYDGGNSAFFNEGTVDILLGGTSAFVTNVFGAVHNEIAFTKQAAHVVYHNGSDAVVRCYDSTGFNEAILAAGVNADDFDGYNDQIMNNYIFIAINDSNEGEAHYTYLTDNAVVLYRVISDYDSDTASSADTLAFLLGNTVRVFRNGVQEVVTGNFDEVRGPDTDLALGYVYAFRRDQSDNNFAVVGPTSTVLATVPFGMNNYRNYWVRPDFFVISFAYPFKMVGINSSGVVTSYTSPNLNSYEDDFERTDTCAVNWVFDDDTGLATLATYNSLKNVINVFDEPANYTTSYLSVNYFY